MLSRRLHSFGVERSERIAALITVDKVETRAPFHVAALAALDYVVLEHNTPEQILSTFYEAGPDVILSKPEHIPFTRRR